jgi:hypothetical protein
MGRNSRDSDDEGDSAEQYLNSMTVIPETAPGESTEPPPLDMLPLSSKRSVGNLSDWRRV